jgi:phosphorylated adapter RNA export protein
MEKESVLETMYEDAPSDWDRFSSDVDMMDIEAEAEAEAVGLEDVPLNNQCATSGVEKPQVQSQKDLASPLSAAAGDDLEKVVNDSNHVTQRKRCPRRKPRRRNKKNSNGIHNINRFVINTCKYLREPKSYLVWEAVKKLGFSAVEELVKQVDTIESRGGQMTADGKRRRTAGGILWNILKSREPEAYKEIMLKGKEFEKQLRKENGKPRITDLGRQPNNKRNRTDSNDSDLGGQPNNKRNKTDSNGSSEKIGHQTTKCTFQNHSRFPKDRQPEISLLENTLQAPSVKAWVNGLKTNNASWENGCRTVANVQETKHPQKAKLPVRDRIRLLVGYDDLVSDGILDHDFKEENSGHI